MSDPVTPAASAASTPASPAPVTTTPAANTTATPPAAVVADAQATLNDPTATKKEVEAAKKTLKKLTLKVDNKTYTEDLPFEIPDSPEAIEWMTRELQMSKMGQSRAQYAAGLEKDVKQFLDDLKNDPISALSDPNIGLDVKALAEKIMLQEIEDSKKSPEQKELEKAKKELKDLKDKQEKDSKDRETAEQQRLTEKFEQEFDTQISQALESNKIPKSEAAVKRILAYAELAVQAGKNVTIDDIIPTIKEELVSEARMHAEALPDDQLEEFFGKALLDRIRKISVAKVKKAAQNPALNAPNKAPNTGTKNDDPKKAEKVSYKSFFGRGV